MQLTQLVNELDSLLAVSRFKDYCPNGLQVEGRAEVKRIVAGVTASAALILLPVQSGGSAIQIRVTDAADKTLYLDASLADNAGLYDFSGHFTQWAHSKTTIDRIAQHTRTLLEKTYVPRG